MADASTVRTSRQYSTGIKVVTIVFTAATGAAAFTSDVMTGEVGKELINVSTKFGSTGPTDDSDLSIVDSNSGRDLVATNGPNSVDNAVVNYVAPETNSIVTGKLTIAIANNAVNNASVTVILVFKSNNI